jgi:hypothetical protein
MHWRTHLFVLFSSLSFMSFMFFELPTPLFPWHSFLKKRGPDSRSDFSSKRVRDSSQNTAVTRICHIGD